MGGSWDGRYSPWRALKGGDWGPGWQGGGDRLGPTHLRGGCGHEVQAGAGGGDLEALGGTGGRCERGPGGSWGSGGHRGLTSGAVGSGGVLPSGSEGSVGVSGDAGGLCRGLGGSVGVSGDIGGLPRGPGVSVSPTRCSTALRSSSAGGLQPTMLSQMPTMCWHCG